MIRIYNWLDNDWIVQIQHSMREANKCTDWLANQSLKLNFGMHSWHSLPDDLITLLSVDVVGVAWPRLVSV